MAIPPSRISGTALRALTPSAHQAPAANAAHSAADTGNGPRLTTCGYWRTLSSTRPGMTIAAATAPSDRTRPLIRPVRMLRPQVPATGAGRSTAAAQHREPAAGIGPGLRDVQAAGPAELTDPVPGDQGPRKPRSRPGGGPQPGQLAPGRGTGRAGLGHHGAAWPDQFRRPAQQRPRVPADADIAVREQDRGPPAGGRQMAEHVTLQRQGAR